MEATYAVTTSSRARGRWLRITQRVVRTIVALLVENARADEFNERFATSSSAQFAALPRGQQNKALDGGARPLSG
jgi:hypothetical protein